MLAAVVAGCAAKSAGDKTVEPASSETHTISIIQAVKTDGGMRISIEADAELNYTAVKQRDPLGVTLYFPLARLDSVPPVRVAENDIVTAVEPSMAENKKSARVEIRLKKDCPYEVEKAGNIIDVRFGGEYAREAVQKGKSEQPELASAVKPAAAVQRAERSASPEPADPSANPRHNSSSAAPAASSQSRQQAGNESSGEPAIVKRVDFSAHVDGKSSVVVETGHPVRYQLKKAAPRVLQLELENTYLPDHHQHRPMITTRFDSAVDRITPSRASTGKNRTHILIELREAVPYRPVQSGKVLKIHFEPSSIAPRPFEAANLPPWQQVLQEAERPSRDMKAEMAEQARAAEEAEDAYADLLGEKEEYTGQKIALDFFETNIKNVFRILQQVSGKNFAIDPNVSGTVTLSFQKPVPWDQVLDLVLQMNQLGKVEKGNIIRIATKHTLREEEGARRQRIEAYKKRQEQQKQLEPMVTEYIPVSYANAGNEVLPHVKEVLSKERGNVTVDSRNNQLIITDTRKKIRKAKEIIARIDKVTPQVIIEARIVEANDNFSRKVGVTWSAASENVYRSDLGGNYSYNSVINTPFIGGATEGGTENPSVFDFSFERLPSMGTPFLLDATLRAMETDQVLKIISTPKIVTLDNKEATITQGIEWPYQSVEDDEVQTEFKKINLTLKVTPHITPDNRVSLEINLQKDDIQEITASGEPAISTNEAQTELLIDNGQTIVIGGIVKRTENDAEAGLPILRDIPGIGWLFSAKQNEVAKRELLIFMTPNIVQLEQRRAIQASSGDAPDV
jgi:type IV pilus assembly protein PilQ